LSSLNNSKDNYFIFKVNYLTSFLITISYPYNYLILFSLPTNMDMNMKDKLTCAFSCPLFILIQISFDIDINTDELLKTIWKHKKKKKLDHHRQCNVKPKWLNTQITLKHYVKFNIQHMWHQTFYQLNLNDPTFQIMLECYVKYNY
jgi:hypothetical protein